MSSFKGDILSSSSTKIIFLALGFLGNILIARSLLPQGQGIFIAIMVLPNIAIQFANFGVRQSSTYYIGKEKAPKADILSSVMLVWIISSLFSIVLVVAGYQVQGLYKHGWLVLSMALLTMPVNIFISYAKGIAMGMRWIKRINLCEIIEATLKFLFVLLLVVYLDLGVLGAVVSFLGALVFEALYVFCWIPKVAPLSFKLIKGLPVELIKKGIGYAAALTIFNLNYRIDIIILEHFVSAADIGHYSIGVTLAELIWQVPAVLGFVIFSHSASAENAHDFSKKTWNMLKRIMPLVIMGSLALAVIAPIFVTRVYGEVYKSSIPVIWILLPGIVVSVAFKILNSDLAGQGMPLVALKVFSVALVLNIGLNFLLIPKYGIMGAGCASTVSYTLSTAVFVWLYVKITGVAHA